jgi:hypothetical protein
VGSGRLDLAALTALLPMLSLRGIRRLPAV